MIARPAGRGEWTGASAVVHREAGSRLAEPDVEVVVVTGEPRRAAFDDQDRVVEVDQLDVARGGRPDLGDQRAGRRPVVRAQVPVRAPGALVTSLPHGPDVDVQAALVRLVARDVAAVLEGRVAHGDPAEAQGLDGPARCFE